MIVVGGLKFGAIYSLAALGIVVIHKATRIVNFAHGAFVLAGAYATYGIVEGLGLGYWPAYLLVPIAAGLLYTGAQPSTAVSTSSGMSKLANTACTSSWSSRASMTRRTRRASFSDSSLKSGEVAVNAIGLPVPRSGNFADRLRVFHFVRAGNHGFQFRNIDIQLFAVHGVCVGVQQ